jgi:hypothetical protein
VYIVGIPKTTYGLTTPRCLDWQHESNRSSTNNGPQDSASRSTAASGTPLAWATLRPELAATTLAYCPYGLRHAACRCGSTLAAPAEITARAGNSTRVLHDTYLHCIDSQDDMVSQQIEDGLDAAPGACLCCDA